MKKRTKKSVTIASILVVVTLLLAVSIPISTATTDKVAKTDTWDGTSESGWYDGSMSYVLSTAEDLAGLAQLINVGVSFEDVHIELGAHIDLQGKEWVPIGDLKPFTGTFDGNGYVVSNLTINQPDKKNVGFFGSINSSGSIANVGIVGADISGGDNTGALAGWVIKGDVFRCYSTGEVKSDDNSTGGLIGKLSYYGSVKYSYSEASVTSTGVVGGLIGAALDNKNIQYSYATGDVTMNLATDGKKQFYAGGLVGDGSRTEIIGCFATGDVVSANIASGLVSGTEDNGIKITNSYATGNVTGLIQAGLTTIDTYERKIVNSYGNSTVTVKGNGTNGTEYILGTTGVTPEQAKEMEFLSLLNDISGAVGATYGIDSTFNSGFPYLTGITQVITDEVQTIDAGEEVTFVITNNYIPGAIKVFINGIEVPESMLHMEYGSTVVTVLSDYTAALGDGLQKISFTTIDNTAGLVEEFIVVAIADAGGNENVDPPLDTGGEEKPSDAEINPPYTGQGDRVFLFGILAIMSLLVITYIAIKKEKSA